MTPSATAAVVHASTTATAATATMRAAPFIRRHCKDFVASLRIAAGEGASHRLTEDIAMERNYWKLATIGTALAGVTALSTGLTTAWMLRPAAEAQAQAAPVASTPSAPPVTPYVARVS